VVGVVDGALRLLFLHDVADGDAGWHDEAKRGRGRKEFDCF
jgi:hypothetical protein